MKKALKILRLEFQSDTEDEKYPAAYGLMQADVPISTKSVYWTYSHGMNKLYINGKGVTLCSKN